MKVDIAVIGGSGLYEMEGFTVEDEINLSTPFGMPSDKIVVGKFKGKSVAFLPRHGKGHRLLPHEVNYRANIFALKLLGVKRIISVSAVGSMKEEIKPGDFVIPDQFIDMTKKRETTFFGDGIAAHISFADPICPELSQIIADASEALGYRTHRKGVYICIEGPQFSTRAESNLYRTWDVDVIGMTNAPEAKLAREAEICYATIAMATDYDCWYEEEEDVSAEAVVKILMENIAKAKKLIAHVIEKIPDERECPCKDALKNAIMTKKELIPVETLRKLQPIIGKYV